jgi:hypothetical protein
LAEIQTLKPRLLALPQANLGRIPQWLPPRDSTS